jgi:hypothetical protein
VQALANAKDFSQKRRRCTYEIETDLVTGGYRIGAVRLYGFCGRCWCFRHDHVHIVLDVSRNANANANAGSGANANAGSGSSPNAGSGAGGGPSGGASGGAYDDDNVAGGNAAYDYYRSHGSSGQDIHSEEGD